ncbi:ATP-binding cassette domain-containing protein, partial [Rhizobium ruizarguesonis]
LAGLQAGFLDRLDGADGHVVFMGVESADIDVTAELGRFSVAVQQVVAIARAVDLSGKVMILDEPTASLDNQEVALL